MRLYFILINYLLNCTNLVLNRFEVGKKSYDLVIWLVDMGLISSNIGNY